MCENTVEKLPFIKRYVPDPYKTQKMYDKASLEKDGMLQKLKKWVIEQLIIMLKD